MTILRNKQKTNRIILMAIFIFQETCKHHYILLQVKNSINLKLKKAFFKNIF